MSNFVRRHALIALSLTTFLLFGAAAAEARDRGHDRDRVVKDALIGAAVGTIAQIVRGRDEGRQLLNGALVGGAIGAAVGASRDDGRRYDRYDRHGYDDRDRYDRHDRYDDRGYGRYDDSYRNDAYYDANHRSHRDGRRHRGCN